MTVTLESNLNNESAGSLYPGARGKITFTVKPLVDDLNGVTINLSRVLKVTGNVVVEDGKTLTSDAQTLLGLAKGHLLFFMSCQNGYYSGRVVDSKIRIDKSEFCKKGSSETTESKEVSLYWVWPEYFQNFVLTGNTNYYKNLFAAAGDAKSDYGALQADMNAHKATTSMARQTAQVLPTLLRFRLTCPSATPPSARRCTTMPTSRSAIRSNTFNLELALRRA